MMRDPRALAVEQEARRTHLPIIRDGGLAFQVACSGCEWSLIWTLDVMERRGLVHQQLAHDAAHAEHDGHIRSLVIAALRPRAAPDFY